MVIWASLDATQKYMKFKFKLKQSQLRKMITDPHNVALAYHMTATPLLSLFIRLLYFSEL